ncbi:uronyl 2-sulfotransferase-like [Amphiura filiformis]|uniref:uronyl 2-sulfotransferase-like n=1 Tax=Amphiura filiformis TaxID=82378 RepID=UPI003B213DBA
MAPKLKKVLLGGLILVSATILTWMQLYSKITTVTNIGISEPYELKRLKKSELVQQTKELIQSRLLRAESLANEGPSLKIHKANIDTGNNFIGRKAPATPIIAPKTLEQKYGSCVNYYAWNDAYPDSYKSLPLKSEEDSPAQPQDHVVFNRVGKCGSRSVIALLRHLAIINNFNLISSVVNNMTVIHEAWQESIVYSIEQFKTPFLVQRHLYYVDFTYYGAKPPVYINIIRDPLARMVSQYYFRRFGDGKIINGTHKDRYSGPEEERNQTFDDCVLRSKWECTGLNTFYIVPFFCGQHTNCRTPSMWALNQAIENVEEDYLFVGILEELEDSLSVLERLLPSMFKGALEHYLHPLDTSAMTSTATLHKKKPSPQVEQIMKEAMWFEYQFYNYVRYKFNQTRDALGITPYKSRPSHVTWGKLKKEKLSVPDQCMW